MLYVINNHLFNDRVQQKYFRKLVHNWIRNNGNILDPEDFEDIKVPIVHSSDIVIIKNASCL
jgi:hypothetical protein